MKGGQCPSCGRHYQANQYGRLRRHRIAGGVPCPGSGTQVSDSAVDIAARERAVEEIAAERVRVVVAEAAAEILAVTGLHQDCEDLVLGVLHRYFGPSSRGLDIVPAAVTDEERQFQRDVAAGKICHFDTYPAVTRLELAEGTTPLCKHHLKRFKALPRDKVASREDVDAPCPDCGCRYTGTHDCTRGR